MDYFASPSRRTAPVPSGSPGVAVLAAPGAQPEDGEVCSVCPHRVADHDVIGLRFCHATVAGSLSRGCVCA
jgi:hypothetical protein